MAMSLYEIGDEYELNKYSLLSLPAYGQTSSRGLDHWTTKTNYMYIVLEVRSVSLALALYWAEQGPRSSR